MRIILANGSYIKLENDGEPIKNELKGNYYIYGHRWHKNEGRWGKFCILFIFDEYEWVELEENELPTIKPLDIG